MIVKIQIKYKVLLMISREEINYEAKKIVACAVLTTFTFSLSTYVSATEEVSNKVNIETRVEEVTGTDDISTNLSESNKYIAVADGVNTTVGIPRNPSDAISLDGAYNEDGNINIYLPNEAVDSDSNISENGTVVYEKDEKSASFAVQPIHDSSNEGIRALININNNTAPKEYSFTFDLEKGSKLISDAEYLGEEYSTGEIFIVNSSNIIVGIIDKPWAYDANGNKVDTYYRIDNGNTLTQIVNFTNSNAFPIVADPSAWQIAKCAGSITWAIGSGIFAWAKLVKIKRYIAALGGVREAAALMLGATTWAEKAEKGGQALVNLAAEITGVAAIKENCF